MKASPLPPQWLCLEGLVDFVQQESNNTWTSTCPECGGEQHSDGEWPDRCTIFIDPNPTLFCRRCGLVAFPNTYGADTRRPTLEETEKWRQAQIDRELARQRSVELALKNLERSKIWEQYHNNLTEETRRIWRSRGIPDSLQDFWQLGYDHAHEFWYNGTVFRSPTITIPIFETGWVPHNVKHRLLQPVKEQDKYRPEFSGLPQKPFLTDPEADYTGHVLALEGEVKAMVVAIAIGKMNGEVLGLPGLTPGKQVINDLSRAERVTIVVDPGGRQAAWNMCKQIGTNKCSVFIPTERMGKIDDYINREHPSSNEVYWLIRQGAMPAWR